MTDPNGGFAAIDDVLADLRSVRGIDDNRIERQAAREEMERQFQAGTAEPEKER